MASISSAGRGGAGDVAKPSPQTTAPQSNRQHLARKLTGEILLQLRPDVDARKFFGERWARVRPLRGTRDQFVFTLPTPTAEDTLVEANQLAADARVAWAEPNFLSQISQEASAPLLLARWPLQNTGVNGATPHADVNAVGAWTNLTNDAAMVIAVLDDGVRMDHPDLNGNIFSNPGESLNGLDDDGNGYVDDVHGWDFFGNDNDPSPEFPNDNHGTASAGVVAANNTNGSAGVAYECKIMPLRVMGNGNWASDSAIAEAIYYAAGRTRDGKATWRGADVICIGLSFPQSAAVDSALLWASTNGRSGKGCPIFAAAGDDASRWRTTRVRLPVGEMEGAGTFQFGFEYSKDVSSSGGEDLVRVDNVALLAGDGMTQLDTALGPSGRQDFEGVFPPPGWQLEASLGAPLWIATTNGALTGTKGGISAQSAPLANNQWTELRTPVLTLSGDETLSFSCYVSSEADYDGLKVWVYDEAGNYLDVFEGAFESPLLSGAMPISSGIHYPARHPSVIAIGASTDCDVRSDYSQTGPQLEFLAPSSGGWNDVTSTAANIASDASAGAGKDYVYDFGGTSAACPLAAGIGALVLCANPDLTASGVRGLLRNACDKIGGVAYDGSGWNVFYGHGRLNAQRAVAAAIITTFTNRQFVIAGAVYYPLAAGSLTIPGKPISDAALRLTGDSSQSTTTSNDGTYRFTVNGAANSTVTPSVPDHGLPASGVTTIDISLIRRHILQIAKLDSPYKLLAADVNGSKSITTLDISWARRLILDVTNSFPAGLWRLVPADYVFPDPLKPWDAPSSRSYTNLVSDHTGQDFLAIKLGDVNGSWTPPAALMGAAALKTAKAAPLPQTAGPEVVFQASSHTNQPGETVVAHVSVSHFRQVTSAQFTLTWDPMVLRYEGTGDYGLASLEAGSFGGLSADQGSLAFSWDDERGVSLADGSTIFTVRFKAVGSPGAASLLELTDAIAEREVGINFAPAAFRGQSGQVRMSGTTAQAALPRQGAAQ